MTSWKKMLRKHAYWTPKSRPQPIQTPASSMSIMCCTTHRKNREILVPIVFEFSPKDCSNKVAYECDFDYWNEEG